MGFYVGTLLFVGMTLVCAFMVPVMYVTLRNTVMAKREVLDRVYELGHAVHGRGADHYEDLTTLGALREARLFLFGILLSNPLVIAYKYHSGLNLYAADYFALRAEFRIALVVRALMVQEENLWWPFHHHEEIHYYSASMAVWGTALFTSFLLMLMVNTTGIPVPPFRVQIAESTLTPGLSRGRDLLAEGFSLNRNSAGTGVEHAEIKGVYDYKVLAMELRRDRKHYGRIRLIPDGKQQAELKDCVLVSCYFAPKDKGSSEVAVQGRKVVELKTQDFQERPSAELFAVEVPEMKESVRADFVFPRPQTEPYTLFTNYVFEGSFTMEEEPPRCKVHADHTLWE